MTDETPKRQPWLLLLTDKVEGFFLFLFSKIGLKKFVAWYEAHREGMRYLVFGGLTTLINIITFMIFQVFCPTLISNFIAWVVAVAFAYVTNKICVFRAQTRTAGGLVKEIFLFLWARVLTLGLEEVLVYLTIDCWHWHTLLMKVLISILVIIANWVLSKIMVFTKKKKQPAVPATVDNVTPDTTVDTATSGSETPDVPAANA